MNNLDSILDQTIPWSFDVNFFSASDIVFVCEGIIVFKLEQSKTFLRTAVIIKLSRIKGFRSHSVNESN